MTDKCYLCRMNLIEIDSLDYPGVEIFASLTEAQLRNVLEPDKGIFIAESPKVIAVALKQGYEPLAFMCERRHVEGDAAPLLAGFDEVPVYVGARELLAGLTKRVTCNAAFCLIPKKSVVFVAELTQDESVQCEGICMGCHKMHCINRIEDDFQTRRRIARMTDMPLHYGYSRIFGK